MGTIEPFGITRHWHASTLRGYLRVPKKNRIWRRHTDTFYVLGIDGVFQAGPGVAYNDVWSLIYRHVKAGMPQTLRKEIGKLKLYNEVHLTWWRPKERDSRVVWSSNEDFNKSAHYKMLLTATNHGDVIRPDAYSVGYIGMWKLEPLVEEATQVRTALLEKKRRYEEEVRRQREEQRLRSAPREGSQTEVETQSSQTHWTRIAIKDDPPAGGTWVLDKISDYVPSLSHASPWVYAIYQRTTSVQTRTDTYRNGQWRRGRTRTEVWEEQVVIHVGVNGFHMQAKKLLAQIAPRTWTQDDFSTIDWGRVVNRNERKR